MLSKKQLGDAAKCRVYKDCIKCSVNNDGCKYDSRCIDKIAQTALALADILKRLEYNGHGGTCPICVGVIDHKSECELAALLKGLEGEK